MSPHETFNELLKPKKQHQKVYLLYGENRGDGCAGVYKWKAQAMEVGRIRCNKGEVGWLEFSVEEMEVE